MNPVKCYLLSLLFIPTFAFGQQTLSLSDAVRIASDSSLTAFRERNLYLAGYWGYRSYLAQKKPSLTLNSTLVDYNRTLTKRYDSELDIDVYREQQNIFSYVNASVSQNLPFTGGTIYVDSEIGRIQNLGDTDYTQFSTVPLRIGLIQPILGYNAFKWRRKTEPLKYEMAQKNYVQSAERIALTITGYFFDLLDAQNRVALATVNMANADTLYAIGQKRLEIATISREEMLTLRVEALNARNELAQAKKLLNSARFAFFSYMRMPESNAVTLIIPEQLPAFRVDFDKALTEARANNPLLLEYKQQVLESAGNVEKVRREGLLDATLVASYGLNKLDDKLPDTYMDPLDQQRVSIGLSIPIIDWGQRRGDFNMARSNYEAVKLTAEQAETDFRQAVMLAVSDFNMQQDVVTTALETREAARQAYNITRQRFMIGKTDVNSLVLALERQDQSNLNYIEALRFYWQYYYRVRQLTLYDFEQERTLMEDFDREFDLR